MQRRQNGSTASTPDFVVITKLEYSQTPYTVALLTWISATTPITIASAEIPSQGGPPLLLPGKTPLFESRLNVEPTPAVLNGYEFVYQKEPFGIWARRGSQGQESTSPPATLGSDSQSTVTGVITSTATSIAPGSAEGNRSRGSSAGVTKGAAAGLAIACLLAGVLLAGLVFWYCWGRRKPSRAQDYDASSTALVPHEKGFAARAISVGGRFQANSLMGDILPLPLEDKAVTGEISKISNSIKNHVQSYYHADRVNAALLDLDDIHAIGNSLPISVETISTLLGNTATREIALRFCIAWVVCSRILPGADSRTSLLPLGVTECYENITNTHQGAAHTSSVARWRILTADLMKSSYTITPSDSRNHSIAEALGSLEKILRPYADSRMDHGQRKHNLEEILKRSALFAFTLFSQPGTWRFDWREEQGVKSGELCIFPALVQLSDENGQRVSPPQPFSEAVVRRLES